MLRPHQMRRNPECREVIRLRAVVTDYAYKAAAGGRCHYERFAYVKIVDGMGPCAFVEALGEVLPSPETIVMRSARKCDHERIKPAAFDDGREFPHHPVGMTGDREDGLRTINVTFDDVLPAVVFHVDALGPQGR